MSLVENSNSDSLYSRPECHILSKAFSRSKTTAAVDILLLKFMVMWSASLIHWSLVLWCAWKPNWLPFRKFLSSMCFWTVLKITISNSLPVVDKRLLGRNFWRKVLSLPGFGRLMIYTSFQGAWRWLSRKQWLNKRVKCIRDLLGRCRRHSFGIPSKPQAFLNFKNSISFETSQGRKLTSQSQSHVTTDDQSVSKSWIWAPCGSCDRILISVWHLRVLFYREVGSVICRSHWFRFDIYEYFLYNLGTDRIENPALLTVLLLLRVYLLLRKCVYRAVA
jgi:hypothetical protein